MVTQETDSRSYIGSVPFKANSGGSFSFTIRFQRSVRDDWHWFSETVDGKLGNGVVLVTSPEHTASVANPTSFDGIFESFDPGWKVETFFGTSGSPNITFDVSLSIPSTEFESTRSLGRPVQLDRYYALEKQSSPWIQPEHGSRSYTCGRDALLVGMKRTDGLHVAILGVADLASGCASVVSSGEGGEMKCRTRNDKGAEGKHRLIVGVSESHEGAVKLCFDRLRRTITYGIPGRVEEADMGVIDVKRAQNWYDGLTYCTWNSLGPKLSEQRILDALADLDKSGIMISTLIIDDNWQTRDDANRWLRFEADPVAFPKGLAHTTAAIRKRFPHIRNIIVWHAMLGYWEGFSPDGEIAKNYKVTRMYWHGGWPVHVVDPVPDPEGKEEVQRLYDDFYRFLSESGVDGVKCDVQCAINEFDKPHDRFAVTKAYQDAFEAASIKHFGRKVIYCMAMQPYIMQNALLSKNAITAVLRNSDDFFPDIADSHAWHIFANAHNSIYTGQLNCLPDWDMFQTTLKSNFSRAHALARVISGGPVYITDTPGLHDLGIVNGMCARMVDGSGNHIVTRLATGPSVVDPYINKHRITWLRNSHGANGYARIIAGFNTGAVSLLERIHEGNIDTLLGFDKGASDPTQQYLIISPRTIGEITENIVVTRPFYLPSITPIEITFEPMDSVLLSLIPVYPTSDTETMAVLGLTNQLCAPAAVIETIVSMYDDDGSGLERITIQLRLSALGTLSIWLSDAQSRSTDQILVLVNGAAFGVDHIELKDNRLQINLLDAPPSENGEVRVTIML
ncbi:glycoside hydrolase [Ascobolus immersus RN42]|uniref:Glycoside hydrolase n=1 Tax=Ascobolus immersus RN42 TaxID=1160509 RepID=A0A3N4IBH4_ASCIM|nr:glycoside hydrolase [Ascobolus immersus RN42]